jgi:hypothetical protein
MAKYIIQDSTLTGIADAIRAKTGGSSAMTPAQMATEIAAIPSGTTITDGIVFNALDSTGKPTAVTYYGEMLNTWQFNGNMYGGMWKPLTSVTCNNVKRVGKETFAGLTNLQTILGLFSDGLLYMDEGCFKGANLPTSITLPSTLESTQGGGLFENATGLVNVIDLHPGRIQSNFCRNCKSLKSYIGERITQFWGQQQFYGCSALESVQIGSIGNAVFDIQYNNTFTGCTNSNLVITYFAKGDYVDRLVSYTRNGATNATIIIKASEETTYNGTTYAAGDTILASEVSA